MTRSNQKQQKHKQRKQRQRNAKKQKQASRSSSIHIPEPTGSVLQKLNEIFEYIDGDDSEYALELLTELAERSPNSAAVARVEYDIFRGLGDYDRASQAARRLLKLVPQNPEAMYYFAHVNLYCNRASVALIEFRKFVDRWPNHEFADGARAAIEVCELESRRRVDLANESGGLELAFENGGLEFYARHEDSLGQMASRNLAKAIDLLKQNIKQQPKFISSRNNLAICKFYQGDFEEAVTTARATCKLAPDNRFAKANLIKIEFLTGNPDKANELANLAIVDPPTEQDAFTALVETLGYLGRDEDLIVLSQLMDQIQPLDEDKQAELLHSFAVANYRVGDPDESQELWEACLDIKPNHHDALENLDDIELETGHAAWSQAIEKWLPRPFLMEMIKHYEINPSSNQGWQFHDHPVIATIVPALLDRGDPSGREFALNFAIGAKTPPMLAAVKEFAFGTRGPDSLRYNALTALQAQSVIGIGPHRFYSRGAWTEIKLLGFEITTEPDRVGSWEDELLEEGYVAMQNGHFKVAENAFQRVLDRDPDCRSARFNLAGVWHRRQRGDEGEKAEQELRNIFADHPDYSFAALAVAILEAEDGNLELAHDLIRTIFERPKLHITEATMLLSTQVQVALIDDDLETAESALNMMRQLSHEDEPSMIVLNKKIARYRAKTRLTECLWGTD